MQSGRRYIGEGLLDMICDAWPKMLTRLAIMRTGYLDKSAHPTAREFEQINKSHSYGRQVYQYLWACAIDGIKPNKTHVARDLNTSRSNVNDIITAFQEIGLLDADCKPTETYEVIYRRRIKEALNEPAVKSFVLAAHAYYSIRRVDHLEDIIETTDTKNVYWREGVPEKIDSDAAAIIYEEWVGAAFNPIQRIADVDKTDESQSAEIVQFEDGSPS